MEVESDPVKKAHLAEVYGRLVGKYTIPMDPMFHHERERSKLGLLCRHTDRLPLALHR